MSCSNPYSGVEVVGCATRVGGLFRNRFVVALLLGVTCLPAAAQFILSPKSVVETGMGTFSPTITPLTALIDQSGLDHPFVSGKTEFDPYFAPLNSNFSQNADKTKWMSQVAFDLPLTGTLDFDLGGTYLLSKVAIYNVSVKQLSISVSQDSNGPWTKVGTYTMFNYQAFLSLRAEVLAFPSEVSARYVRFAIEDEFSAGAGFRFGYVTLSEVAFRARAASVPPPTIAIGRAGNGDVEVNFTGILQWKAAVDGTFEDVPGNPSGKYTIPQSELVSGEPRFFRSRL